MNLRYGYNRFLRGDQGNPGNRGIDLTSLGFPAVLQRPDSVETSGGSRASTSPAIRARASAGEDRSPKTRRHRRRSTRRWARTRSGPALEWRQYRENEHVLRQQPDRAVQFRHDLDTRAARQLRRPRPTRSASRSPRSCSGCPRPAASSTVTTATTSSRRRRASSSRTTGGSVAPDGQSGPALRVRNAADRGEQSQRARLRRRRVQPMEAAAARRAERGGRRAFRASSSTSGAA